MTRHHFTNSHSTYRDSAAHRGWTEYADLTVNSFGIGFLIRASEGDAFYAKALPRIGSRDLMGANFLAMRRRCSSASARRGLREKGSGPVLKIVTVPVQLVSHSQIR